MLIDKKHNRKLNMPYVKCFYHVIWATKSRQPLITRPIETLLLATIRQKSLELRCPILELNAVEDHVHVAVCIVPRVSAADWIRQVKGFTTYAINTNFLDLENRFKWQEGYGLVTFGEKNLPFVRGYIAHQKEHHAKGRTILKLESTDDEL